MDANSQLIHTMSNAAYGSTCTKCEALTALISKLQLQNQQLARELDRQRAVLPLSMPHSPAPIQSDPSTQPSTTTPGCEHSKDAANRRFAVKAMIVPPGRVKMSDMTLEPQIRRSLESSLLYPLHYP